MAGLVPAISLRRALRCAAYRDRRIKPGNDNWGSNAVARNADVHNRFVTSHAGCVPNKLPTSALRFRSIRARNFAKRGD